MSNRNYPQAVLHSSGLRELGGDTYRYSDVQIRQAGVKRLARRIGASLVIAAGVGGGVRLVTNVGGQILQTPTPIVSLASKSSPNKYKVTIKEGGDISRTVQAFAAAEGDQINLDNENSPVSQGIDQDSKSISAAISSDIYGDGVQAGQSFDVAPTEPVVDPEALRIAGASITKIPSNQK